jgi:oxygen-independent coproporphyrinogen-3 oxidase
VDTVYFGGGTPSLLSAEQITALLRAVQESFEVTPNAEITLECNPATANADFFTRIRRAGVNRLSIGMQSAMDNELALLGRAHSRADFVSCFTQAREAGFDNVSVDLMYGIPDQTDDSLSRSLDFLISLSPEHISTYGLSIEEGTDFYRRQSALSLADGDAQAQMYLAISNSLRQAGYQKYEISNFAKVDFESRHNMRYWRSLEYVGFGVAAHSYFGGERYGNSRDIHAFLRGEDIVCEREVITAEEQQREFIMLGLRLSDGISLPDYQARFGDSAPLLSTAQKFIKGGFMTLSDERLAFTDKGFLVSNTILSELIDAS